MSAVPKKYPSFHLLCEVRGVVQREKKSLKIAICISWTEIVWNGHQPESSGLTGSWVFQCHRYHLWPEYGYRFNISEFILHLQLNCDWRNNWDRWEHHKVGNWLFQIIFFFLLKVLQPAPHQVITNLPEGVRLPTTRPTRPPPPLIPSSKTTVASEKPSFLLGGSISQVRGLLFPGDSLVVTVL